MSWSEIALICVGCVLVIVVLAWIVTTSRQRGKDKDKKVDDYEIIDGVRYTKDDKVIGNSGEAKITLKKGDKMLEQRLGPGAAGKAFRRHKILKGDLYAVHGYIGENQKV